jgi:hypothetical protein
MCKKRVRGVKDSRVQVKRTHFYDNNCIFR